MIFMLVIAELRVIHGRISQSWQYLHIYTLKQNALYRFCLFREQLMANGGMDIEVNKALISLFEDEPMIPWQDEDKVRLSYFLKR